jgi:hypothetical protein
MSPFKVRTSAMKIEAVYFSETLVPTYKCPHAITTQKINIECTE